MGITRKAVFARVKRGRPRGVDDYSISLQHLIPYDESVVYSGRTDHYQFPAEIDGLNFIWQKTVDGIRFAYYADIPADVGLAAARRWDYFTVDYGILLRIWNAMHGNQFPSADLIVKNLGDEWRRVLRFAFPRWKGLQSIWDYLDPDTLKVRSKEAIVASVKWIDEEYGVLYKQALTTYNRKVLSVDMDFEQVATLLNHMEEFPHEFIDKYVEKHSLSMRFMMDGGVFTDGQRTLVCNAEGKYEVRENEKN